MIERSSYIASVKLYYSFLESEFGFNKVNEIINGNVFYDVEYRCNNKVISISYENVENHLEVIFFKLIKGKMPNYEDKSKTLHLNYLNTAVVKKVDKEEINSNLQYFSKYNAKDELERKLLKGAKELRLCLKYLNQLRIA